MAAAHAAAFLRSYFRIVHYFYILIKNLYNYMLNIYCNLFFLMLKLIGLKNMRSGRVEKGVCDPEFN